MESLDLNSEVDKTPPKRVTRDEFDALVERVNELYEWARRGQVW